MNDNDLVYTSISISNSQWKRFDSCAASLGVSRTVLLSTLCYKAGLHVCRVVKSLKTVEYQERAGEYRSMPVHFFSADHEYMHGNRLASKVSVSKLLALAMDLFLDEIMEKGINQMEIAHLRVIQNTYKKKSYQIRNFSFDIIKNDQFEEYIMKMRYEKT